MKNLLSWLGAAAIAAVVCGGAFLSGCGAETDGDGNQEVGQTAEAITYPAQGNLLFGSDANGFHCTKNGPASQDCRWQLQYEFNQPSPNNRPARFSLLTDEPSGADGATVTAAENTVVAGMNGQLGNSAQLDFAGDINTAAHIGVGSKFPPPLAGNTSVAAYITYTRPVCESAAETEIPSETGTFRHCKNTNVLIDYAKLKANFPAASFAGNARQVFAAAVLIAMGTGFQNAGSPAYSNTALSNAVQLNHAFLTPQEALQIKRASELIFSANDPFIVTQ